MKRFHLVSLACALTAALCLAACSKTGTDTTAPSAPASAASR